MGLQRRRPRRDAPGQEFVRRRRDPKPWQDLSRPGTKAGPPRGPQRPRGRGPVVVKNPTENPATVPAVEKPATAEELARRLSEATAAGSAVIPVGGGRSSGMGAAPQRSDLELHTTKLDRLLEHSQA